MENREATPATPATAASAASEALDHAEHLSRQARHSGRWYAFYLVTFAVASFAFAALFGVLGNRWGAALLTPLWGVLVGLLSVWAARQRTALVGMTRIHLAVILSWTVLWGVTVIVGSSYFQGRPAWWVAGGLAMAVPPLIGAWVSYRRTAT